MEELLFGEFFTPIMEELLVVADLSSMKDVM